MKTQKAKAASRKAPNTIEERARAPLTVTLDSKSAVICREIAGLFDANLDDTASGLLVEYAWDRAEEIREDRRREANGESTLYPESEEALEQNIKRAASRRQARLRASVNR